MRGGKKDLMTFHSKKLAEYMSIDLDGGKSFEISTVIGIHKDYLNEQQMSLDSYSGRFRGGPRGPGPLLRESKKLEKGPIKGKFCLEVTEKKKIALLPPPHRIAEITENFCYYPLLPPPH